MRVKITVVESNCRCGCMHQGDEFVVGDLCPPICHELWQSIYPSVYTLINGGRLDCGDQRVTHFDARCGDGGRVRVHGEVIE